MWWSWWLDRTDRTDKTNIIDFNLIFKVTCDWQLWQFLRCFDLLSLWMDGAPVTKKRPHLNQRKEKDVLFVQKRRRRYLRTELSLELGKSNKIILR